MKDVTYPVLASAGSDRSLGGALSMVFPVVAASPSPIHRHPGFTPLDQRKTARGKVSDAHPEWKTPQKPI
jgi:hypothetical protein